MYIMPDMGGLMPDGTWELIRDKIIEHGNKPRATIKPTALKEIECLSDGESVVYVGGNRAKIEIALHQDKRLTTLLRVYPTVNERRGLKREKLTLTNEQVEELRLTIQLISL